MSNTEAAIKGLLDGLTQGSVESFDAFDTLIAKRLLSDAQICRCLVVIFLHLNESEWPSEASQEAYVRALNLPVRSMMSVKKIVEFLPSAGIDPYKAAWKMLFDSWPRVWNWLEFLAEVVEDANVPMPHRELAKQAASITIVLYISNPILRPAVSSLPTIVPLVIRLWCMEITEPRILTDPSNVATLLTRCFSMVADEKAYEELQDVFRETIDYRSVARCALSHLKLHEGGPSSEISIRIIYYMTTYGHLRYRLLTQGSVPAVTRALRKSSNITEIGLCFVYLGYTFQEGNGITWIIQALKAGLLPELLRSSRFAEELGADVANVVILKRLSGYLIYESVLIASARALQDLEQLDIEDQYLVEEPIKGHWVEYKNLIRDGLQAAGRRFEDDNTALQYSCSYQMCTRRITKMGRCSGCITSCYCSRSHQKADWKARHRDYCKLVQSQPEGYAFAISGQDLDFLQTTLRQDIQKSNVLASLSSSSNLVLFIYDFQAIPSSKTFTFKFNHEFPVTPELPMDDELDVRWATLLERSKYISSPRALVIVTLPMGTISTILMGAMDFSNPESLMLS